MSDFPKQPPPDYWLAICLPSGITLELANHHVRTRDNRTRALIASSKRFVGSPFTFLDTARSISGCAHD
jgi:uncharacterized protein (DUF2252 family)